MTQTRGKLNNKIIVSSKMLKSSSLGNTNLGNLF